MSEAICGDLTVAYRCIDAELRGADFGDARLASRLVRVASLLARSPDRRLNGQAWSRGPDGESRRWAGQVEQVEARKPPGLSLIHVGDRETDAFEMLEAVHSLRFVLRANHDRRVFDEGESTHLREACERADVSTTLEVDVSRRKARKQPGAAKSFPAREARVARVAVRGLSVSIRDPYN